VKSEKDQGGFAVDSIKKAIETALEEIKDLPEDERKKQIKALRLRWHPDKNPVLTEFATEVSKIINGAVSSPIIAYFRASLPPISHLFSLALSHAPAVSCPITLKPPAQTSMTPFLPPSPFPLSNIQSDDS
jgi:hypothetical protein